MNCLRSLEHYDRGFESHSRHIRISVCVYSVFRQRPCGGLITRLRSPTDYVKKDYETEEEARVHRIVLEPLINENE
jgi:hypothetical protein